MSSRPNIMSAAVFLWYDSVTRVGASKEGLLAGPLETIVVLILAWLLLKEKLRKIQLVGVIIALLGFFATVSSRLKQALNMEICFPSTFPRLQQHLSGKMLAPP